MAQKRSGRPYIWATSLPRLLTGENSCEWAAWFKAHHENWAKAPNDFNQAQWMLDHTALVNRVREQQESIGHAVSTENQNTFHLRGATATLAGKPDLIAEKSHQVTVIDAKTGRPSPAHRVQVMIYQYAIPRALKQYESRDVQGRVAYPDCNVGAPASAVNPGFIGNLAGLIRRLASDTPARRVPSATECRFCDITAADCSARIESDGDTTGETEDF